MNTASHQKRQGHFLEDRRCARLHELCAQIEAARSNGMTVRQAVQKARKNRCVRLFKRGRLSRSRLTMLYYEWRRHRSPETFFRHYAKPTMRIPLALIEEFLNRLVTNRVVPASAVMASLRADWRMGRAVPGLGTWRDYWKQQHGEQAVRATPPKFPFSQRTLYVYLSSPTPAEYQRRIVAALHAQRELNRFFAFIEGRRNALASRRCHEPLGEGSAALLSARQKSTTPNPQEKT